MRQSYDFGQKDSLVTDSVTYKFILSALRVQHTLQYTKDNYEYHDYSPVDSDYYKYLQFALSDRTDTVKFTGLLAKSHKTTCDHFLPPKK